MPRTGDMKFAAVLAPGLLSERQMQRWRLLQARLETEGHGISAEEPQDAQAFAAACRQAAHRKAETLLCVGDDLAFSAMLDALTGLDMAGVSLAFLPLQKLTREWLPFRLRDDLPEVVRRLLAAEPVRTELATLTAPQETGGEIRTVRVAGRVSLARASARGRRLLDPAFLKGAAHALNLHIRADGYSLYRGKVAALSIESPSSGEGAAEPNTFDLVLTRSTGWLQDWSARRRLKRGQTGGMHALSRHKVRRVEILAVGQDNAAIVEEAVVEIDGRFFGHLPMHLEVAGRSILLKV